MEFLMRKGVGQLYSSQLSLLDGYCNFNELHIFKPCSLKFRRFLEKNTQSMKKFNPDLVKKLVILEMLIFRVLWTYFENESVSSTNFLAVVHQNRHP